MDASTLRLTFDAGTVILTGADAELLLQLPGCRFDQRTSTHRAEGRWYRAIVEFLRKHKIAYQDDARAYQVTPWKLEGPRKPFPHQIEALDTWSAQQSRGVVVLPTGTGKTFLALLAIQKTARPALIITPTIDLLNQWFDELASAFGEASVGALGGGSYNLQPLTVSTYDSAHLYVERWGNRYGLLVFDECHHLPGASYMLAAVGSIAPFRLGLTATPERADGQDMMFPELIGPIVFRREIKQLSGDYLAEYQTQRVYVDLSADEQTRYQQARDQYRHFVEDRGISMGSPAGWQRFLQETYRSPEGRAAFLAYREQKRIPQASPSKLRELERLLEKHRGDRILIFTADNATVYQIARQFLVPAITHQTKTKERRTVLQGFRDGSYPILVTSQVLNEGVDVPQANVGVILSGTGSVREHVQRLGRLLRKVGDKQAILYEVVTRGTAEEYTSERRRQHHAYQ